MTNPDLERLLELRSEMTLGIDDSYHGLTKKEEQEYESLIKKMIRLEKADKYDRLVVNNQNNALGSAIKEINDKEQQIKQLKDANDYQKEMLDRYLSEIQSLKSQLEEAKEAKNPRTRIFTCDSCMTVEKNGCVEK